MTGCSRSCCTTTRGSSRTLLSSRTWSGASWDAALNLSMTWGAGRRESVSPRHLQFHINCIQRFRMPTLFPLISPVTEVRSPPSEGNIYLIEIFLFSPRTITSPCWWRSSSPTCSGRSSSTSTPAVSHCSPGLSSVPSHTRGLLLI